MWKRLWSREYCGDILPNSQSKQTLKEIYITEQQTAWKFRRKVLVEKDHELYFIISRVPKKKKCTQFCFAIESTWKYCIDSNRMDKHSDLIHRFKSQNNMRKLHVSWKCTSNNSLGYKHQSLHMLKL